MSTSAGTSAAPSPANRPPSFARIATKHVVLGGLMTAVLVLGSGRVDWWRAWVYVAIVVSLQNVVAVVLHRRSPDLLAERSRIQEGTPWWDKILVVVVALAGPFIMWLVAAWDVRTHWPPGVPPPWSAVALGLCVAGGLLTFRAMLANRFFSATVRIQSDRGHAVIAGGPYRYVRHPGYTGAIAFTLGTPIALGSYRALTPALVTVAALVLRTALEDRMLRKRLEGYSEYTARVRSRLVPGIW